MEMVDIKGYEGLYKITSIGQVISLPNKGCHKSKFLKNSIGSQGYLRVNLSKNGRQKVHRVHRLVAIHFIPNPENKPQVNHKNGIKTDIRVENLEWVTASENNQHAYDTGLKSKGENHYNAKLSNHEVETIRDLYSSGKWTQQAISDLYPVCRENIRDIVNNRKRT